jgi:hypothetical protein
MRLWLLQSLLALLAVTVMVTVTVLGTMTHADCNKGDELARGVCKELTRNDWW